MVAIKQDTTVQPGGIIQIHSDELPPGARAQVIVLIDHPVPPVFPSMRSLMGGAQGAFRSPGEIDAFLTAERDAWQP